MVLGDLCLNQPRRGSAGDISNASSQGVVFRQIVEGFQRSCIVEASQPCSVVVVNESEEEGGAVGLAEKAGAAGIVARRRQCVHGFGQAAVEALSHSIGARGVGSGGQMSDPVGRAEGIERVFAGRFRRISGPDPFGEAVGELGAIIAEHGVDLVSESLEEALHGGGDRCLGAVGQDLDMGEAGGAFDGDEGEFRDRLELSDRKSVV